MQQLRAAMLVASLACVSFASGVVVASPDDAAPILTAEQLHRHVADAAGRGSPLDAMPPGARRRFVDQLAFGERGLGGFGVADLEDTLTDAQIKAVLGLFGEEEFAQHLSGLAVAVAPRDFISEFEQRYDAFQQVTQKLQPRDAEQARQAYLRLLTGADPVALAPTLDRYDRALLYRATLQTLQQTPSMLLAEQARDLLALMHGQGHASTRHVAALFDAVVGARQFDLAEQLRTAYPDAELPAVPAQDFSGEPGRNSMLQVSDDGSRLSRVAIDFDDGLRIVVVAGCHFSHDAARAISADPALDALFRRHATWLASSAQSFANAAEWNRELPTQPIHIAWSEHDWPQLESWDMPTFHVFRDGKLLTRWSGWPADSGMATLQERLRAAGVDY